MLLYMIYRNPKKVISEHVVDLEKLGPTICSEITIVIPKVNDSGNGFVEDQNAKGQAMEIMKAIDVVNKL